MTISPPEAESVLAIDIGNVHTRAMFFDIADGQYRLIALGQAKTTAQAPIQDVGLGVREAVAQIQEITGRVLLGADQRLIVPTRPDGAGIDRVALTLSVGPALHIVTVGLLSDVSLESARRLATSTYGNVMESIGLNDRRSSQAQIDAILHTDPDVIIIVGGADDGADRPVNKLVEVVGLACYLLPAERRPTVLYAGNPALLEKIKAALDGFALFQYAPNVRPDYDTEDLAPAEGVLMQIAEQARARKVNGLANLTSQASTPPMTAAYGLGRMVRFLSRVNDGSKGVLGIDLGASATTVAAAYTGQLHLNVQPVGMGESCLELLESARLEEITQWLPIDLPDALVRETLHTKALYPATIPASAEDMAIEQAVARYILRGAAKNLARIPGIPSGVIYEPIFASGSVVANAPTAGQSLLMLLDGLQPTGITTFVLDQNNLAASLGAIANFNLTLPVQVFESGAFMYLGTVVSPVSTARPGATIVEAKLVREDGSETEVEIKQGGLYVLPVPHGQTAQLFLDTVNHTQISMSRPGRGVKITGGVLGAVIDARGRPLNLGADPARRREILKKWAWTFEA